MQEISLDLDCLEQERKLHAADPLNHLHKMKVCTSLKDVPIAPLQSQQVAEKPSTEGWTSINQEIPNTGSLPATQLEDASSAEDNEERHSDTPHTKAHCFLIIIFILSLALILLASLALSAYALNLIARANKAMLDFSSSQQLHRKYLEEIREWKTILQLVFNHSSSLQAK